MSRISRLKKGESFYQLCEHIGCDCPLCVATNTYYCQISTPALDKMADMSDEALRVFLAVCRAENSNSPFEAVDREVLQRLTGMSLDRVELGIIENVRKGIIRDDETLYFEHSAAGGIFLERSYHEYFNSKAPTFTIEEFLNHIDEPEPTDAGFIYVLCAGNGYYKIGKTVDPESRLKSYATHLPESPEIITVRRVNSMAKFEEGLHEFYHQYHIRREWFRIPPEHAEWLHATHDGGATT